ncbi:putative quinol monooxygenase [Maridesulfovibrio sp.]|uniref:putative quinol monooxygenase n=1 Tax=unclassified Maridesulfovibrio TaxID=2794999 RepID=UPI003AFFF58C
MKKAHTVIARIEARKESIELVKAELLKLIEPTRKEEGCIQYDLHQDKERPEVFFFYENWVSRELLQTHLANTHIAEYARAVDGHIVSFTLNELTRIA